MQKIEFKIIASIIIFTIFIVTLQRYQFSENIIEQFKEAKKAKNRLLIETISPIVSLNISLGLSNSNDSYLESIIKNNDDLESIRVLGSSKKVLCLKRKNDITNIEKMDFTYVKHKLVDSLTDEYLGTIELLFSDEDYKNIIRKNREISINIFIISFCLLALFVYFVLREFRELIVLTQNVLAYDPKKNNYPMNKHSKNNEVGLIHNAIITMVQKIGLHSQELDEINAKLEEKVQQRTQELEIQKAKAEELVKVKSKFLANMSHEIRTPMNAIIGMNYILNKTALNEKQYKLLNKIQKVSNNLLNIISDILDFSKLESGKFKIEYREFEMDTLMENIHNIFEYKIEEKGLFYIVQKPEKKMIFYGDPLRIEQILINLISNAIKFTEMGTIGLKLEYLENGMVRFIVIDDGIGLTKEQQNGLFEAFYQVDASTTRKYGGTGLGLSIVKQLIQQMGGNIFVKSEIGKGSEFSFELKLMKDSKSHKSKSLVEEELKKDTFVDTSELEEASAQKIDELFVLLGIKAKTKLAKEFEPVLNTLKRYRLSKSDRKFLQEIQSFYKTYDFKKIIQHMEER